MRPRTLRMILPVLFASFALAQSQRDLAYLLDGVKEIAPARFLGPLCITGGRAFPVVNGRSESGALEPVVAAARFGNGRVVALTGYLEDDIRDVADTARTLLKIARWLWRWRGRAWSSDKSDRERYAI